MRFTSMSSIVVAVLCAATQVSAQPDPFSAYEMDRPLGTDPVDAPLPGGDARVMTTEGAFTASIGGVFNVTRSANGLADGSERRHSTFFTHLAPAIGWFVIDGLELRVAPGIVWRELDRGSSGTSTDRSWLLDAGARYHLVLGPKLAVYGGMGIGGYVGASDRKVQVIEVVDGEENPTTVREATETAGFALGAEAGLGIVLSSDLVLDAGLDLRWLVGSETIESESESLSTSTFNTGVAIRLRYIF